MDKKIEDRKWHQKVIDYADELTKDPKKAKEFLQRAGIITKTGKLTKPYRDNIKNDIIVVSNTVWKIRDRNTGLFSMGGSMPSFNKTGKVWKKLAHLKSHFSQVGSGHYGNCNVYKDCDIVEYEIIEVSAQCAQTFLKIIEDRNMAREAQNKARQDQWEKQRRFEQYEKLRKEFE